MNQKEAIRIPIGKSIVTYDEQGNAKDMTFTPAAMTLNSLAIWNKTPGEILEQISKAILDGTKGDEGREAVKQGAEVALATWYNHMNEIELADRSKYEIVSEMEECEEYENGGVKKCGMMFYFRELEKKEIETVFSVN